MPKNHARKSSFERRAIVALGCYFLIIQTFLAGLALGLSAGTVRAADGTVTFICHGAGLPEAETGAPATDGKAGKFLCGLCALAHSVQALPPAPEDFVPISRAFSRFVPPAERVPALSAFDPRDGRSRAPPVFV